MRSARLYKVRKTKRNLFYKDAISKLPDPQRSFKAPVILINGFSGVGKLTVAQQLRRIMLPGAKIFDYNHLVDLAGVRLNGNFVSEHFQNVVTLERRALLRRLRLGDLDDAHTAYIFTEVSNRYKNTCMMHAQKPSLDYWNAVHDTYRPFISIILTCEIDEIIERLRSPDRFTNNKPWPLSNSHHYRIDEKERLFEFGTSRELKLDISYLSPESAAECIRDHIEDLEEEPEVLVHSTHFLFPPLEMTVGEKSIIPASPDPGSWREERRKPCAEKETWLDPDETEWDDVPWRPLPWKPLPRVRRRLSRKVGKTLMMIEDVPSPSETDGGTAASAE